MRDYHNVNEALGGSYTNATCNMRYAIRDMQYATSDTAVH